MTSDKSTAGLDNLTNCEMAVFVLTAQGGKGPRERQSRNESEDFHYAMIYDLTKDRYLTREKRSENDR
jgi:hypothetical protein